MGGSYIEVSHSGQLMNFAHAAAVEDALVAPVCTVHSVRWQWTVELRIYRKGQQQMIPCWLKTHQFARGISEK